jgi:heterodisulfide reductase subunit C
MKWEISKETMSSKFIDTVEDKCGQNISSCYQCGKCSAGCPVCYDMDYTPNQIMRLIQIGLEDEVLNCSSIWMCASCNTCTTRCPLEIDIASVMDALRIISNKADAVKKAKPKKFVSDLAKRAYSGLLTTLDMDVTSNLKVFSKVFLGCIKEYGRLSEFGLILNYNINSGNLLSSVNNLPAFLSRSKLKIKPADLKRIEKARRIFEKLNIK